MQKLWIAEVEGSKAGAAVAEASKKSRLRECFSHVSTVVHVVYIDFSMLYPPGGVIKHEPTYLPSE